MSGKEAIALDAVKEAQAGLEEARRIPYGPISGPLSGKPDPKAAARKRLRQALSNAYTIGVPVSKLAEVAGFATQRRLRRLLDPAAGGKETGR